MIVFSRDGTAAGATELADMIGFLDRDNGTTAPTIQHRTDMVELAAAQEVHLGFSVGRDGASPLPATFGISGDFRVTLIDRL